MKNMTIEAGYRTYEGYYETEIGPDGVTTITAHFAALNKSAPLEPDSTVEETARQLLKQLVGLYDGFLR